MRHGRAAVRHGQSALGPLGARLRGSIHAGELGEHAGAVEFAGGAAVGEPRRFRAVPSLRALFRLTVMRAGLTVGSHLSVTMYKKLAHLF